MPDGEKGLSLWEMYPAARVLCVIGILASNLQHPLQARAGGLFVLVKGVGIDIPRGGGRHRFSAAAWRRCLGGWAARARR